MTAPHSLLAWGPRQVPPRDRPGRQAQPRPQPLPAHAGLWLDRMVASPWSEDDKEWAARRGLYEAAVQALKPGSRTDDDPPALRTYLPLFQRWRRAVTSPVTGTYRRVIELASQSRLLLHPASNESVTDGSLLLHHTYGVPYLPGSALKGVARARLLAAAGSAEAPEQKAQLEGWSDGLLGFVRGGKAARPSRSAAGAEAKAKIQASRVDFLDALWMPPEGAARTRGNGTPLALDVVTPHHPDYYTAGSGARRWPTDGDSPKPVLRLTIAPRVRFLAVAEAAAEVQPWLDWLIDSVLLPALEEDGIGAWTSAGYGRLRSVAGSGSPPEHHPEEWQTAQVIWQPNKRELLAIVGERRAFARAAAAEALLKELPEESRTALLESRNRQTRLEVQIAAEGMSWKIAGLRPLPEP